jgi:hypothetical protein
LALHQQTLSRLKNGKNIAAAVPFMIKDPFTNKAVCFGKSLQPAQTVTPDRTGARARWVIAVTLLKRNRHLDPEIVKNLL